MAVYRMPQKVDTQNASAVTEQLLALYASEGPVVVDAEDMEYISSAGLRALLNLLKKQGTLRVIHVKDEVWNILEMTGFTELMQVERAFRKMSVEGCPIIGQGAQGTVYRLNSDTIVKVYRDPAALEKIRHEREMARKALVLGLPTAISFDIVRVGDQYASVYELLDCSSMSAMIAWNPANLEPCAKKFADLLRTVHSLHAERTTMHHAEDVISRWYGAVAPGLSDGSAKKLELLLCTIPETDTLCHGDFHTNNVLLQDGEPMLIDMDTLGVGHPVFDLANIWITYIGFARIDPDMVRNFLGIPADTCARFWYHFLPLYLQTEDPARINAVQDRAMLLGMMRMISHMARRGMTKEPRYQELCANTLRAIEALTVKLESLGF